MDVHKLLRKFIAQIAAGGSYQIKHNGYVETGSDFQRFRHGFHTCISDISKIQCQKLEQPAPNLMDLILGHKIDVVIDTPPQGVEHQKDGFVIRRNAIETGVNVLTSLDTAEALATSLENTDLNNLSLIDIATIARR